MKELSETFIMAYLGLFSKYVATKISKFENPQVIIFIRNQYDIIVFRIYNILRKGEIILFQDILLIKI